MKDWRKSRVNPDPHYRQITGPLQWMKCNQVGCDAEFENLRDLASHKRSHSSCKIEEASLLPSSLGGIWSNH